MIQEDLATCNHCYKDIVKGDSVYDDGASYYYCDDDCMRKWVDDNIDYVIEYYIGINKT